MEGGVIFAESNENLEILVKNCTFSENSGGIFWVEKAKKVEILNSYFTDNYSPLQGGVLNIIEAE